MNIAIIFAGGSGVRMGAGIPKQFLEINGKPILVHTLQLFQNHDMIDKIYLSVLEKYIPYVDELVKDFRLSKVCGIVAGGETGQDSIYNALKKAEEENDGDSIVLIHDGVRPFASEDLLKKMVASMDESLCRALVPVLPVTDTLRSTVEGEKAVDRSKILRVQTPQVFFSEDIKAAYRGPFELGFTDDASVAERCGVKIKTIPGESFNIKITTPEDMVFAEAILRQ